MTKTDEERKAYFKKYNAEHREERKRGYKKWRKANMDREREYKRTWRAEHPELHQASSREYNRTHRPEIMFKSAKSRAKKYQLSFELTVDWIKNKIKSGTCEVTGLPFDIVNNSPYRQNPFTPTLDRKDPSKGYTTDNTQVVVWVYNCAKCDWTHEIVMTLAKALNATTVV